MCVKTLRFLSRVYYLVVSTNNPLMCPFYTTLSPLKHVDFLEISSQSKEAIEAIH